MGKKALRAQAKNDKLINNDEYIKSIYSRTSEGLKQQNKVNVGFPGDTPKKFIKYNLYDPVKILNLNNDSLNDKRVNLGVEGATPKKIFEYNSLDPIHSNGTTNSFSPPKDGIISFNTVLLLSNNIIINS